VSFAQAPRGREGGLFLLRRAGEAAG
jgi:hypothetical protein